MLAWLVRGLECWFFIPRDCLRADLVIVLPRKRSFLIRDRAQDGVSRVGIHGAHTAQMPQHDLVVSFDFAGIVLSLSDS